MSNHHDGNTYSVLDSDETVDVPPGTSLLVVASEPAGRRFLLSGLARGLRDGEGLLVITADDPAGAVANDLREQFDSTPDDLAARLEVIDCQTDEVDADVVEQNVNTPRNLTDIGIGFKNALDEFDAAGVDRIRFGLLSLSILLSYIDQETCYRFCQTLTRGLDNEGAVGQFLLNANAHDEETMRTLERAFDAKVEVEHGDDGLRVRFSGLTDVPEAWMQVEP